MRYNYAREADNGVDKACCVFFLGSFVYTTFLDFYFSQPFSHEHVTTCPTLCFMSTHSWCKSSCALSRANIFEIIIFNQQSNSISFTKSASYFQNLPSKLKCFFAIHGRRYCYINHQGRLQFPFIRTSAEYMSRTSARNAHTLWK